MTTSADQLDLIARVTPPAPTTEMPRDPDEAVWREAPARRDKRDLPECDFPGCGRSAPWGYGSGRKPSQPEVNACRDHRAWASRRAGGGRP